MHDTYQDTLFEDGNAERQFYEVINRLYSQDAAIRALDTIDWDFRGFTTQYLSHTFHSYPARFIPQIPLTFIKLFTKKDDVVLDPMCGSGTTLVEAFLSNRHAVGNDFNPLAILISKVKTKLIEPEQFEHFDDMLTRLNSFTGISDDEVEQKRDALPNRKLSKVFTDDVIRELHAIYSLLMKTHEDGYEDLYDLGRVALSSTIWTLVESEPKNNVDSIFLRKYQMMKKELMKMKRIVPEPRDVRLIEGDARFLDVQSESVDLIVTSPPYVNALDYYRIHMYNMHWLGIDFKKFKKQEIGAHSHFISNRFRLLSEYLGDMLRTLIEMSRVLKDEKICAVVVGNSSLEYELIESHRFFENMCDCTGLGLKKKIFRNIDTTRKYTTTNIGKIDDEYILVFQKENDPSFSSDNDSQIASKVKKMMLEFREQFRSNPGSSIRGKKPTKERIQFNIEKITSAINSISEDVKIKR